jgi:inner membrane protein involved in colicin E2 resistance
MATYMEYELSNGGTIWIETDETEGRATKASREDNGDLVQRATQTFDKAFESVKQSMILLRDQLSALEMDEVEVSFDIKVTGEAGFAICKAGAEANFSVALKWKKPTN